MQNSDRRAAIKKLKLLVFSSRSEVDPFRKKIEEAFYSVYVPNSVECHKVQYGSVACEELVPVVYATNRVMLYVHGGSFVGGSCASWRSFCASIANASSTLTIVPEIRLAPQYPFPAAVEDVQAVFSHIYNNYDEIVVCADGSGASIAMALMFSLKDSFRNKISSVILFSPILNLVPTSTLFLQKKFTDEVMSLDCLKRCGDIYTYASNLSNPLVSALEANNSLLENFPPVYIQMGEKELLLSDARRFAGKLKDIGQQCILDVWDDMIFMFQMVDSELAESHLAIERVGKYIQNLKKSTDL